MGAFTPEPFGRLVRRYRRDAELTQEALAERAGLSVRAIRDIEGGSTHRHRQDTVRLLLDALQVPADEQAVYYDATVPPATGIQELPSGAFLGALPAHPLIGRAAELGQLLAAVESVLEGAGRLVLLAGEAGTGKTRLAQEVTRHVHERGFVLAAGRCYEPEHTVPYYPFLDALTTLLRVAPAALTQEIPRRWPYLGRLLPDEIPLTAPLDSHGQDEELLLFRAVTGCLEALAAETPVALMLDDLHWADHASLKLLLHLARHTRGARILLLATYRDVELTQEHPLRGALRDLERERLVDRVAVRPLGPAEAAALMAATVGEREVSAQLTDLVYERTEGNPFFIQQVVRALRERTDLSGDGGGLSRDALARIEVPETIRSVVGQRVARLMPETQDALHAASVLGQVFRFDDLLAMGSCEDEALEEALEEAATAALVHTVDGELFRFDHALTQQSLEAELPPRRKRRLHRAAGAAIERLSEHERDGRSAELTWHFLRGDEAERALPYAEQAGDRAVAVFASADAEQHYRTAIELARRLSDDGRAASLLWKLGNVLRAVARYDEALDAYRQAAQSYRRTGQVEEEARTVLESALVHYFRGSQETGQAAIRELLAAHAGEGGSPYFLLASEYRQGMDALLAGKLQEYLAPAERACTVAHALGEPRLIAFWEVMRGGGLRLAGRPMEALPVLREAVGRAEACGDLLIHYTSLLMLGDAYLHLGDAERAHSTVERAGELAERMRNQGWVAYVLAHQGAALAQLGRWREARQHAERAVALSRPEARTWSSVLPLLSLGDLSILEGAWEDADRFLAEAMAVADEIDDPPWKVWGRCSLAELAFMQGHPEQALAQLQLTVTTPRGEAYSPFTSPILAAIYLETGATDEAEDVIRQGSAQAAATHHPLALVPWLRLQGVLLTTKQQWNEAEQTFTEAVSLPRSLPYPYAEAQAQYEWGRMELQRGRQEEGRELLERALAIFQRLGAQPFVERVQQVLAEPPRKIDPLRP
jgi:tetratricopeptide (TPR) repeat protein/transcriptional regulator with XRE-family HTH domain